MKSNLTTSFSPLQPHALANFSLTPKRDFVSPQAAGAEKPFAARAGH
jgi:hypothetical protein